MREIAHPCLFDFFLGSSKAPHQSPRTDFHAKYVKRIVSAHGCAFSGLENKNITLKPLNPENRYLGPDFDGTWKIFGKKPLYNGVAPCKLPQLSS